MNISVVETKRELVVIGHRLGLVEALLNKRGDFSQALKAKRAMRSVIDAVVEIDYVIDGGIDKLIWKE